MVQKSLLKLPAYTVLTLCIIVLILRFSVVLFHIPIENYPIFFQQAPIIYLSYTPIFSTLMLLGFQFSVLVITCNHFNIYRYCSKNYWLILLILLLTNSLAIPTIDYVVYETIISLSSLETINSTLFTSIAEAITLNLESFSYFAVMYLLILRSKRFLFPSDDNLSASPRYWRNLHLVILFFVAYTLYLNFLNLFVFF